MKSHYFTGFFLRGSCLWALCLGGWLAVPGARAADAAVGALRDRALPLRAAQDLDPLLALVGDASLVLLGEASHGTSEFYSWRDLISRRLIEEQGFNFIAVEGDWATIYRLNRYAKGLPSPHASAREAMRTFDRWPVWMWANAETEALVEWLREYNADRPFKERVGIYGMDVYGETVSMQKAVDLLRPLDAALAEAVAGDYACFDAYDRDMRRYAQFLRFGEDSCAAAAERAYERVRDRLATWEGDELEAYALFSVKQHAKVVMNAERHYRLMGLSDTGSWNARADHFYAVVQRLLTWHGEGARGVVWAHNTHIGDARATPMGQAGRRNIGQIAREQRAAGDVLAVGFGTHRGTVQAGRAWGAPMETMPVPEGGAGSVEDLMQRTGQAAALFLFDDDAGLFPLMRPLGHRAIGVVYQPEREFPGNYVPTVLPRRYDAFLFIAETRALEPVD